MNKKILNTLIIIIILVIVGVVLYWYWQSQRPAAVNQNSNINMIDDSMTDGSTLPDLNQPAGSDNSDQNITTPTITNIPLHSTLYYFVERFGTYSNVSDFQNIEDLKPVVAPDFYNTVIAQRKNLTFAEQTSIAYDAYDAKVVQVDWLEETSDAATAQVTTRRHHITEDSNEPFSQDIVVRFQKINDQWLVTEAVWQ